MPCRALEAFRRTASTLFVVGDKYLVLMPCRALEAFRRSGNIPARSGQPSNSVLMPCRALEAFRL